MKKNFIIIFYIFVLSGTIFSNTWQNVTSGYPGINNLEFSSLCDGGTGVVFAGSWASGGVYRTADNGVTWTQVSTQINFEGLTIDPNTPSTLWGANWDSSMMADIATNALSPAITWQNRQTGMTATSTHSIKTAGSNSSQLVCATTLGTYRTVNAGLTWTRVDPLNPASGVTIMSLFQSPWNTDELYLCGDNMVAVYSWSNDKITTLSTVTSRVIWMSFDCAKQGNYYFIKSSGAVYYYDKTSNTTTFISQVPGESNARCIENVCCCGTPALYTGGDYSGVQLSTDNGLTWKAYNSGMSFVTGIGSMMQDCADGYLWAGTNGTGHGLWRNDICQSTPTSTPGGPTNTPTPVMTPTVTSTIPAVPVQTPTITPTWTPYPEGAIVIFPNPSSISTDKHVRFENLPKDSKILIYTLAGEGVIFFSPEIPVYSWQLKNDRGSRVSPGIYYYVVMWDDDTKKIIGKIFLTK